MTCEYCKRPDGHCINTRDMEQFAIEGENECFYQLAKLGGGEAGLKYVINNREARIKRLRDPIAPILTLPNGTAIWREENEVGGHRYWSDAIGGGVAIWDTCLASIEELEAAIEYEKRQVIKK